MITWIVIPLTFCWINVLVAADVNFEVPLGQRQLFLDDFGIQETHNLQHTKLAVYQANLRFQNKLN